MSEGRGPLEVAQALIAAVEAGDLEALRVLYHPEAVLWQNLTRQSVGREQAVKTVGYLVRTLTDLRYEDIRVQATASGFVQQQTLVATTRSGAELRVDACLVVVVEEGLILRVDEYLDSGQLAPLRA